MLRAIQAKEQAHLAYLSAITAYNKAQIRLLLLLGQTSLRAAATGGVARTGRRDRLAASCGEHGRRHA